MIQIATPQFPFERKATYLANLSLVQERGLDIVWTGRTFDLRHTFGVEHAWYSCSTCGKLWGKLITRPMMDDFSPVHHRAYATYCPLHAREPRDMLGAQFWAHVYAISHDFATFCLMNLDPERIAA